MICSLYTKSKTRTSSRISQLITSQNIQLTKPQELLHDVIVEKARKNT